MKARKLIFFFAAVLLTAAFASAQAAPLRWNVPKQVSQGHAFPAYAESDAPFTAVFSWLDDEIAVKAEPAAARGGKPVWKAGILLGVPLESEGDMLLTARIGEASKSFSIRTLRVAWPKSILTVAPRYVQPPEDVLEKIARDREHSRQALALRTEKQWSLPLLRPVPGGITSPFGGRRVFNGQPRAPHRGTDLRSPEGAPVRAVADGTAVLVEEQYYGGSTIYLDHGQGVFSVYCHLLEPSVAMGEHVTRGQVIAKSGSTGRVTGAHLHFGFIVQGVSVDAMPLLSFPPAVTGGPSRSIFEKGRTPKKTSRSKK